MPGIFYKLPQNLLNIFRGRNLLAHLLAIVVTYLLVVSGLDWLYFKSFQHPILISIISPGWVIGGLLPVLGPVAILIYARIFRNSQLMNTGWALGQAAILGSLISSTYKAFTGRIPPVMYDVTNDISSGFQLGLWRNGIFWGWPSSHTTIAFAMAITLILLYAHNQKIRYIGLLYAFYIGFGVSFSIHWLSEFMAGAIIGTVIGLVVGSAFRQRHTENVI